MSRRAGQVVLGLGPHQASLELRRGSQGAAEGRLGLGAQGGAVSAFSRRPCAHSGLGAFRAGLLRSLAPYVGV